MPSARCCSYTPLRRDIALGARGGIAHDDAGGAARARGGQIDDAAAVGGDLGGAVTCCPSWLQP